MAVTICGALLHDRLEVSGNLETTLRLPSREGRFFYLAFSDGTLVEGRNEDGACRFRLHTEGAGLTAIRREGDRDVLELGWTIEWVTIAPDDGSAYPVTAREPLPALPGLFEERGTKRREPA